jgi:hypothetical protein
MNFGCGLGPGAAAIGPARAQAAATVTDSDSETEMEAELPERRKLSCRPQRRRPGPARRRAVILTAPGCGSLSERTEPESHWQTVNSTLAAMHSCVFQLSSGLPAT